MNPYINSTVSVKLTSGESIPFNLNNISALKIEDGKFVMKLRRLQNPHELREEDFIILLSTWSKFLKARKEILC
jgi:hypothetical protein